MLTRQPKIASESCQLLTPRQGNQVNSSAAIGIAAADTSSDHHQCHHTTTTTTTNSNTPITIIVTIIILKEFLVLDCVWFGLVSWLHPLVLRSHSCKGSGNHMGY